MKSSKQKKNESILLRTWDVYDFKLFPGNDTTKPYIHFNYLNPDTGRKERVRKLQGLKPKMSFKAIKQEANEAIEDIIQLLSQGWNPITNSFPNISLKPNANINQCIQHWLCHREQKVQHGALREKGLKMNKYLMDYFQKWVDKKCYGTRSPNSLTKIDIENFLEETGSIRKWGKISYNQYRTDLGTFFKYLLTLKVISANPVSLTSKKSTKQDSSRFKIFEESDLQSVHAALSTDKRFRGLYVASKILFKLNIRPIELTRIQVKDIDLQKRLLTLQPEKTKNKNEARFELDDDLQELIKAFSENSHPDFYLFGGRNKPGKNQLCEDYFGAQWRYFRAAHNVPHHLKFYALKHTSNYFDIEAGSSYEEIRQRNRHANLQITTLYIRERLYKSIIKPSPSVKF